MKVIPETRRSFAFMLLCYVYFLHLCCYAMFIILHLCCYAMFIFLHLCCYAIFIFWIYYNKYIDSLMRQHSRHQVHIFNDAST
jgi:Ca2+/Na+ antiporter